MDFPVGGNLRIDLVSGRLTAVAARTRVLGSTTIRNAHNSVVPFKVKLNRQGRKELARRKKLALTIRAIIIVGGKQSVVTSPVTLKR
jgi:hypothetical protein